MAGRDAHPAENHDSFPTQQLRHHPLRLIHKEFHAAEGFGVFIGRLFYPVGGTLPNQGIGIGQQYRGMGNDDKLRALTGQFVQPRQYGQLPLR